jgi:hypothetical protein
MSPFKSLVFALFASLLCGFLLFVLAYGLPGRPESVSPSSPRVSGRGFAALTLDESWPDRTIRELLADRGLTQTIGESSQWVFLDDFGKLEQVPLDSYWDRVEPFDPRNDGYAERLQSFFVFNGRRRIFIDLKGAPLDLEGRVRAALGDIRYSLSVLSPPRSPVLPAVLFIAASALSLLLSREILTALFFLPLWAPLAALGAPGFALIALLAGLFSVLREPAREFLVSRRYGTAGGAAMPSPDVWALSGLFLAAAALLAVFGGLPPLIVPGALVFFPLVLWVSLRAESCGGAQAGHIRFRPVQITPLALRRLPCSPVMIPFALAAVTLPLVSALVPAAGRPDAGRAWAGWESPLELSAEHYREHAAVQQAFSYTPLDSGKSPYLHYFLAEDGLISGDDSVAVFAEPETIPPFPLASLIDFLAGYAYTDPGPVSPYGGELVCPLIVSGLCVPLIFRDRRGRRMRGKLLMYMDKRMPPEVAVLERAVKEGYV